MSRAANIARGRVRGRLWPWPRPCWIIKERPLDVSCTCRGGPQESALLDFIVWGSQFHRCLPRERDHSSVMNPSQRCAIGAFGNSSMCSMTDQRLPTQSTEAHRNPRGALLSEEPWGESHPTGRVSRRQAGRGTRGLLRDPWTCSCWRWRLVEVLESLGANSPKEFPPVGLSETPDLANFPQEFPPVERP